MKITALTSNLKNRYTNKKIDGGILCHQKNLQKKTWQIQS